MTDITITGGFATAGHLLEVRDLYVQFRTRDGVAKVLLRRETEDDILALDVS